jgi:hypothetical protein
MDPENVIKGRIAEAIIEELLRTSGNRVYRFGYESILQNLVQHDSNFDRYRAIEKGSAIRKGVKSGVK